MSDVYIENYLTKEVFSKVFKLSNTGLGGGKNP